MLIKRIGPKTALVADVLTVDTISDIGNTIEVHVIGRDSSGDPVVPGAGTFTVTAQTAQDGAFYAIADGGTLDATLCGGSATTTGTGVFTSFRGAPLTIKVTPTGITTAVSYTVEVVQIGV